MNNAVRAVLVDLSGTLHIDAEQTHGAVAALARLRSAAIPLRFVTNTTKESSARLVAKLTKIGFIIHSHELFSSLVAARTRINNFALRPLLLLEQDALEDFADVHSQPPHNAVVVGLSPNDFNYNKLNEAFQILRNGGKLIAIHKGRCFARSNDIALGPGPFVTALEYAADVTCEVVGKPSPAFFQLAIDSLRKEQGLADLNPSQIVMIGDDVRDDVGGAIQLGMQGYLVKTGKYAVGDETNKGIVPTAVFNTFADAANYILAR